MQQEEQTLEQLLDAEMARKRFVREELGKLNMLEGDIAEILSKTCQRQQEILLYLYKMDPDMAADPRGQGEEGMKPMVLVDLSQQLRAFLSENVGEDGQKSFVFSVDTPEAPVGVGYLPVRAKRRGVEFRFILTPSGVEPARLYLFFSFLSAPWPARRLA